MNTIRVAAAVIRSVNQEGEPVILATQRGYGDYKDWWEFPGGKIESGETPEDALVREIREELDADITVEEFLTTVEYDYPAFHLSMDCFWCSLKEGQLTLLEHEAAKWLPVNNLRQVRWLPADISVLEIIQKRFSDHNSEHTRRIDTIIFDIGNVLMKFDYMTYVHNLFEDDTVRRHVIAAIWESGLWVELDRGEDFGEIRDRAIALDPDYEAEILKAFENAGQCMHKYDYAIPWIRELKERGYRILYLSNYSTFAMKVRPEALDFLPYVDGGVFSCEVRLIKPDPAIYRALCEKYSLQPETCVFLDDTEANVAAARKLGFRTIHVQSFLQAKDQLNRLLDRTPGGPLDFAE